MKSATQNLYLPKITHQNIIQLIDKNKKSPLVHQNLLRKSHKPYPLQSQKSTRNNRYTDTSVRCHEQNFINPYAQSCLQIKSPFYQKLHFQNSDKCPCEFHRLKRSPNKSQIKPKHNSINDELIMKKIQQLKRHQQRKVNYIRQDHENIHMRILQNQKSYAENSMQKSTKLKESKMICNIKNRELTHQKIQKTLSAKLVNKQFKKVFFKEKLDKIYQLDNQNQPFDKIIQKRNGWEKDKRRWGTRIIKYIHKLTKKSKLRQLELGNQKQNSKEANKNLKMQKQLQAQLLAIQKCLPIVLNNLSSINQIITDSVGESLQIKIRQVFTKNLKLDTNQQGEKLFSRFVKIVKQIKQQQRQKQLNALKKKQPQSLNEQNKENKQPIEKDQSIQNKSKQNLFQHSQQLMGASFLSSYSNLNMKGELIKNNSSALSLNAEQIQPRTPLNQKSSLTSLNSAHNKKLSKLSKMSFMSRALSSLSNSSNKKSEFDQEKQRQSDKVERASESLSISRQQNKNSSKLMVQNLSEILGQNNGKKSLHCSFNVTPCLSKQVISQKQQDLYQDDQNEDQQKQKDTQENPYKKSDQQMMDQMQRLQSQRVNYQIQFIKSRIRLRNGVHQIPPKYKHVKYEKFCSKATFGYISSLVDQFSGSIKFRFLYSQLQLKKNVLEDDYIQELIKQFASMFSNQTELNQWKSFLFQQRNKVILEKLNRIIDQGIRQIQHDKSEEINQMQHNVCQSMRTQKNIMFNKFDESQAAFERYLQKLERKNVNKKQSIVLIETPIDLKVQYKPDQQENLITQKTIEENIQEKSTEQKIYIVKNNQPDEQQKEIQASPSKIDKSSSRFDKQSKKKILKYLLRKKPDQFKKLNREVEDFSNLINHTFNK